GPEPVFAEYDDVSAEAASVAVAVERLVAAGTPAAEIAVLYRINAQSEAYEQALSARGIPYQVRGGEGFFQRAEVRQAISALRQAASRDDLPEAAVRGQALVTLVRAALAPVGLTAAEPAGAQARERWSSLVALVSLTEELLAHDLELDLFGLLRELAARAEARHPPTVQGVTLASLHAAKGLEWDAVFLVGLTDGTLPIAHVLADDGSVADQAALEEERRLLYVGVTRAREHLRLSWSLSRTAGGRRSRRRSRFLNDLVPDDSPASRIAAPAARDREANRPRCRVCAKPLIGTYATMLGRCRRCPGEVDAALLDALKQWRAEKAADRGVREFVVLTDTTLTAIAEQLPADDRALGAIAGFGPKKIADHGAEILAIVASRMKAARNDSGAQQPAPAVADARARQGARRGKNHKTAGQK